MDEALPVELRDGRLYVPVQTYEHALSGCCGVALLARDDQWWLFPLQGGAGGLQLKQRTARGDRVVEAQEFFRAQGIDEAQPPLALQLEFEPDRGAFRLAPAVQRSGEA